MELKWSLPNEDSNRDYAIGSSLWAKDIFKLYRVQYNSQLSIVENNT
jgi:hypothetical protein